MANRTSPDPMRSANWLADLVNYARLVWSLWRDPRLPIWLKLIPPGTLIYLLWPIDMLPDFLVGLGQLDDLAVVLLGLRMFVALSPEEIVRQHVDKLAGRWRASNPVSQPSARDVEVVEGQYRVVE